MTRLRARPDWDGDPNEGDNRMPGPPPKPAEQRRRRNKPAGVQTLPAKRTDPPPDWPLRSPSKAETAVWNELWATPQSVAWSKMGTGVVRTVARYVRLAVKADGARTPLEDTKALLPELRQLEDRLGLSPVAMLRLHWQVDDRNELADKRDDRAAEGTRGRMVAVDPDAVGGSV